MLNPEQLHEFAERGFLLLPQAVSPEVVAAASTVIDGLVRANPPDSGVRGPHNFFPEAVNAPALSALLMGSPAFALAESLTGPGTLEAPWQVQVALNIPPFPHRPGMHHIDGAPHEPDGRPGTFTLLAGVLMSDQLAEDAGNLWVWPGTHLTHAEYFTEHGPEAFFDAAGYPPIRLPEPEQIRGRAGDLLLAHYLLGHNIGGNTSEATRRAVYFRVKRVGHNPRWRDFLRDPWLDYDAVREALDRHPLPLRPISRYPAELTVTGGTTVTSLNFDVYLRATPDEVWAALTDHDTVPRWRFGMSFETDWKAHSPLISNSPDGEGTVHESVPGQRLVYGWTQTDHPEANEGHPSTVALTLTPIGEVTHLNVIHDDLAPEGTFLKVVTQGWPMILSSLKSLVETGEPLRFTA